MFFLVRQNTRHSIRAAVRQFKKHSSHLRQLRSHLLSSYNSLTRKLNNATEKDSDSRDHDKIQIYASEIERDMEGIRNIVVTMAYMFQEGEDGFKEMENPHFEDFHPEEVED